MIINKGTSLRYGIRIFGWKYKSRTFYCSNLILEFWMYVNSFPFLSFAFMWLHKNQKSKTARAIAVLPPKDERPPKYLKSFWEGFSFVGLFFNIELFIIS